MKTTDFWPKGKPIDYTINVRGRLMNLGRPVVMGILNATPDSFFAESRVQTEKEIFNRANRIIAEGAEIIDVGACSTRPGGDVATESEEMRRLEMALPVIRKAQPEAVISVDTFRPSVARRCVEEFGVDIINDVEEGRQPGMLETVAELGIPYILMSTAPNLKEMLVRFADALGRLRELKHKDVIIDPGFGFGKTMDENYALLNEMERLQVLELPILVGISRKRMIHRLLDITPQESLNGTTVLNTIALSKGAAILRVHDVRPAVEAVRIYSEMISQTK